MAATARTLRALAHGHEAAADSELGRFAPDQPLVWHFAQGRYATEEGVPRLTRWWAKLDNLRLRLWHRRLKQPKCSREGRLVTPLMRGGQFNRADVRALCRTTRDYIFAEPVGGMPLDAEFRGGNPTKCCPLAEPERDAEHARLYAGRDLREHVCGEMWAENGRLREENEAYRALSPLAEKLIRKCDST